MRAAGAVALILGLGSGCRFDTSGIPLPDRVGHCSATIRGSGGDGTEFHVASSDPEFAGRLLATWCIGGSGSDLDRVRGEWEGHLADTLGNAEFRDRPGPWCVVEGSVTCGLGDSVDRDAFPPCPAPLSGAVLVYCPPPPDPACLQVDPLLDFGPVPVGELRVIPLGIANTCDTEIGVRVGESIQGPQADDFEIADNRCPPPPGDDFRPLAPAGSPGDRCEVDVSFLPFSPLTRGAQYRFLEEPATPVLVELRGEGLGAKASVSPDYLCLEGPFSGPDQCTAPGDYLITNPGPGGIRVVYQMLDPASGTGFRAIAPTPTDGSFIPRNTTAIVRFEWCRALTSNSDEKATYQLTLTGDTAANDTFFLEVETPCP